MHLVNGELGRALLHFLRRRAVIRDADGLRVRGLQLAWHRHLLMHLLSLSRRGALGRGERASVESLRRLALASSLLLLLNLDLLLLLLLLLLHDVGVVVERLVEFELLHLFAILNLLVLGDALLRQLL